MIRSIADLLLLINMGQKDHYGDSERGEKEDGVGADYYYDGDGDSDIDGGEYYYDGGSDGGSNGEQGKSNKRRMSTVA
jgi:hypothetical protein